MNMNNDELEKDLEEQYAMLEEEVQEDKKRKRYLILFIFFLSLFLIMFGSTFSYFKLYSDGQNQEEKNETLKDLYIEGYENAFKFNASIHSYSVIVSKGTTSVNVKYILGNSKMKVDVKGNDSLKEGINTIVITVKDEEGKKEEYIIYVTVPEEEIEEPDVPDTPTPNPNPDTPNIPSASSFVGLQSLSVTNHSLNRSFKKNIYTYSVNDIKETEDSISVNFKVLNSSNSVSLRLNNNTVTRKPNKKGLEYSIKLNVKTELHLGANKLEIVVKDVKGNTKTYTLILVVNPVQTEDQKVVEISVEYGNDNGNYNITNIIPGWESSERQWIKITNNSNYDTNVDISFTNVTNNFVNTNDLEYTLYKDNTAIKTGKLPVNDTLLLGNINIAANSINYYYISYRFIYSDQDQNVDQGKTFSTKLNVSLTK